MSSIAKNVLSGSLWVFISGIVVRLFSFGAQIVLGWMLTKQEFGLYGTAISIAAIFACFQDSGVGKLLIQKTDQFEQYKNPGIVISIILNVIISVAFLIAGYIYSQRAGDPALIGMMAVLALSNLLGTSLIVCRSDIARKLQFKSLAKIDTVSNSLTQLLMIPLAWLGAGSYSFVLPAIASKLYLNFALKKISPIKTSYFKATFWRDIKWLHVKELVRGMPWIMVSALAVALVQKGDYLVLGWMTSPELLGIYFFGFQLTVALSSFLTAPLSQIFMPSLAKLNHDSTRQIQAYERSIKAISIASYPICFGGIILTGPMIHFVWNGKWDEAIIVTQLLLLALPIRFLSPVGRAFLEARGKWRLSASMLVLDGIGTLLSAYWGARGGTLLSVVIQISIWRLFIGALQVVVVPMTFGTNRKETFQYMRHLAYIVLKFLIVATAILGLSLWTKSFRWNDYSIWPAFVASAVFAGIYLLTSLTLFRSETIEIFNTIKNIRKSKPKIA